MPRLPRARHRRGSRSTSRRRGGRWKFWKVVAGASDESSTKSQNVTGKRRNGASPLGTDYQSYFTPNRMMRGPMIVDGNRNDDPLPQVMFEAASELVML